MSTRRALTSLLVLGTVVAAVVFGIRWSAQEIRQQGWWGAPTVPVEYRAILREAAKRCPQVPIEVFAAQITAESGWDPQAVSPAGARGIAQFMPAVWKQYGIDADGDGKATVWNPVDALHSAAELNCVNRRLIKKASGKRLSNTLAAYNAGFNAVLRHDGIPPYPETTAYVEKILRTAQDIEY